jgi:hypothetical protein
MVTSKLCSCTAFAGDDRIAAGTLAEVAAATKAVLDAGTDAPILIFDDTSRIVEVDFRGTLADVLARVPQPEAPPATEPELTEAPRGRGRPKLGVVSREVTLLPRHWQWLATQPGGASVTLRKLVETAKRANLDKDRIRQCQEAACRFMTVMAGDRPGFEEATRALFKGDGQRFEDEIKAWPKDIAEQTRKLAALAQTNVREHLNAEQVSG